MLDFRARGAQRMGDRICSGSADSLDFKLVRAALEPVAVADIGRLQRKRPQPFGYRKQLRCIFHTPQHETATAASPESCNTVKIACKTGC